MPILVRWLRPCGTRRRSREASGARLPTSAWVGAPAHEIQRGLGRPRMRFSVGWGARGSLDDDASASEDDLYVMRFGLDLIADGPVNLDSGEARVGIVPAILMGGIVGLIHPVQLDGDVVWDG